MNKSILQSIMPGIVLIQLASASAFAKPLPVIYGNDDRKDLADLGDSPLRTLADSTVALFKDRDVSSGFLGGGMKLRGGSFQKQKNVCSFEPFADQPAGAFCSGTLIAKNLVLTAGHCITTEAQCRSTQLVFGFDVAEKDVYPLRMNRSQVYRCSRIIARHEDDHTRRDFAVIELDRDVMDHAPVKIAAPADANPAVGSNVVMIGHPYGLPTKVDAGGAVRSAEDPNYFVATTDSYSGSSGSGVFDPQTHEIVGILVSGEEEDFIFDSLNHCFVSKRCSVDACGGEKVSRVSFVPAMIRKFARY